MKIRKSEKAFTIVELVIVIAVIAILAAVLIPTFSGVIQKANTAQDIQLVRNLNTTLTNDRTFGHRHITMQQVVQAIGQSNYDIDNIKSSASGNKILWDSVNDLFCYYNGTDYIYVPEFESDNGVEMKKADYWQILDEYNGDDGFSVYISGDASETLDIKTGVDVGDNVGVKRINYQNVNVEQTIIIRTNDGDKHGTLININDEKVTVKHCGNISTLIIDSIAPDTYYEDGSISGNAIVSQGHMVIGDNADVDSIIVTGNGVKIDGGDSDVDVFVKDGLSEVAVSGEAKVTENVSLTENQLQLAQIFGGIGTTQSPYRLSTEEDIKNLAGISASVDGSYFEMKEDISMTEKVDIGKSVTIYMGGHTLNLAEGSNGENINKEEGNVPGSEPSHAHNYVIKYDAGNHWEECSCKDKKNVSAHVWNDGTVTKTPTCTEAGEKTFVCDCGSTKVETIPANGHSFGSWEHDDSNHWQKCSCGNVANSAPHSWDVCTTTKTPTCTEVGEKTFTCACGATKVETITQLAHTFNIEIADATHLKAKATCTGSAVYYKSCTCGEIGSETFTYGEALSHTFNQENYDAKYLKSEATCKSSAIYYKSCACGEKGDETFNHGAALDHTYDKENHDTQYFKSEATCTSPALYYKSCICGEKGTETFEYDSKLEHTYGDWQHDNDNHWKQCGCGNITNSAQHIWNEGIVTQEATAEANGKKTYTCTVCGATKDESIEYQDPSIMYISSGEQLVEFCGNPAKTNNNLYSCKLTTDIELNSVLLVYKGYITIDLNGHKITFNINTENAENAIEFKNNEDENAFTCQIKNGVIEGYGYNLAYLLKVEQGWQISLDNTTLIHMPTDNYNTYAVFYIDLKCQVNVSNTVMDCYQKIVDSKKEYDSTLSFNSTTFNLNNSCTLSNFAPSNFVIKKCVSVLYGNNNQRICVKTISADDYTYTYQDEGNDSAYFDMSYIKLN